MHSSYSSGITGLVVAGFKFWLTGNLAPSPGALLEWTWPPHPEAKKRKVGGNEPHFSFSSYQLQLLLSFPTRRHGRYTGNRWSLSINTPQNFIAGCTVPMTGPGSPERDRILACPQPLKSWLQLDQKIQVAHLCIAHFCAYKTTQTPLKNVPG